ncbi:MAG: hypothetical protein Q4G40_06780 [Brachybacterium sp.]|nr:hypothetical protein [Brachybacterium sp.]
MTSLAPSVAPISPAVTQSGVASSSSRGADVTYRGRAHGHDYEVQVRHRVLETRAVIIIDGVTHDPWEERSAAKVDDAAQVPTADGIAVRLEEEFSRIRCIVRRPTPEGRMRDAERIIVRTSGLGSAGEVDVTGEDALLGTHLTPETGSTSERRDARVTQHPVRYGLLAAAGASLRYLIPLLGIGALFSGLLRPVREALRAILEPVLLGLAAVLRPIVAVYDAVMQPLRDAVSWVLDLLFGWLPTLSLDLSLNLPPWVVPVVVVLAVFVSTVVRIRRRRAQPEDTASSGV